MTVNIKIEKSMLETQVTVDEYMGILEGDVKVMVRLLSKFVLDENGQYLSQAEGRKVLGTLTLVELQEAVQVFITGVQDTAVPPSSGAV